MQPGFPHAKTRRREECGLMDAQPLRARVGTKPAPTRPLADRELPTSLREDLGPILLNRGGSSNGFRTNAAAACHFPPMADARSTRTSPPRRNRSIAQRVLDDPWPDLTRAHRGTPAGHFQAAGAVKPKAERFSWIGRACLIFFLKSFVLRSLRAWHRPAPRSLLVLRKNLRRNHFPPN